MVHVRTEPNKTLPQLAQNISLPHCHIATLPPLTKLTAPTMTNCVVLSLQVSKEHVSCSLDEISATNSLSSCVFFDFFSPIPECERQMQWQQTATKNKDC